MDQAVVEAERASPELSAAEARVAAARGALVNAQTYPNPEAHVTYGIDWHVGVEQPIEWPGKRALLRALADRDVAAAEVALDGLRIVVAAEARRSFAEALAAKELAAARKVGVSVAQEFVDAATRRVRAGYAGSFEVTRAELEVVRAKLDQRRAEGDAAAALASLAVLLGRDPASPLELSGSLPTSLPTLHVDAILQAALSQHPDVRAQEAVVRAREAAIPAARASALPELRVESFYERSKYAADESTAGIGIALPLPLWNRNRGGVMQTQAELAAARAELDGDKRRITREISAAFAAYDTARGTLALWRPELVEQLEAALARADQEYAAGQINAALRLELEKAYADAVREGIDLRLQAARSASALERATIMTLEQMETP